jgi:hypothetical protein
MVQLQSISSEERLKIPFSHMQFSKKQKSLYKGNEAIRVFEAAQRAATARLGTVWRESKILTSTIAIPYHFRQRVTHHQKFSV